MRCSPWTLFTSVSFKKILRRTWRYIDAHGIDWKSLGIKERELEVRLVTLAVNQLQAPCFMPMIRYAFQKPGYVASSDPITDIFPTTKDVCYNFKTFKGTMSWSRWSQLRWHSLYHLRSLRATTLLSPFSGPGALPQLVSNRPFSLRGHNLHDFFFLIQILLDKTVVKMYRNHGLRCDQMKYTLC